MVRYEPKEILVETLTTRLTDPRGRLSINTNTHIASAGQTEFLITTTNGKKFHAITEVTVEGTEIFKWKDFYIDMQNQKVILKQGVNLDDTVIFTFKEGEKTWIYADKSRIELSLTSYPRISILIVNGPGERQGNYKAEVEHNIHFQVDIWTKEDIGDNSQIFTIDGRKYEGDKLAQILGTMVCEVLEDYENDMYPQLYYYQPITLPRDMPMEDKHQAFHTIVEFELKVINMSADI